MQLSCVSKTSVLKSSTHTLADAIAAALIPSNAHLPLPATTPQRLSSGCSPKRAVSGSLRSRFPDTRCVSCCPRKQQLVAFLRPRPRFDFTPERLCEHEIFAELEDGAPPHERRTCSGMAPAVWHGLHPVEIYRIRVWLHRQPMYPEGAVHVAAAESRSRNSPGFHSHTIFRWLARLLLKQFYTRQGNLDEDNVKPRSVIWAWHDVSL